MSTGGFCQERSHLVQSFPPPRIVQRMSTEQKSQCDYTDGIIQSNSTVTVSALKLTLELQSLGDKAEEHFFRELLPSGLTGTIQ